MLDWLRSRLIRSKRERLSIDLEGRRLQVCQRALSELLEFQNARLDEHRHRMMTDYEATLATLESPADISERNDRLQSVYPTLKAFLMPPEKMIALGAYARLSDLMNRSSVISAEDELQQFVHFAPHIDQAISLIDVEGISNRSPRASLRSALRAELRVNINRWRSKLLAEAETVGCSRLREISETAVTEFLDLSRSYRLRGASDALDELLGDRQVQTLSDMLGHTSGS